MVFVLPTCEQEAVGRLHSLPEGPCGPRGILELRRAQEPMNAASLKHVIKLRIKRKEKLETLTMHVTGKLSKRATWKLKAGSEDRGLGGAPRAAAKVRSTSGAAILAWAGFSLRFNF